MKADEIFTSKYLKAADIKGREPRVQVQKVTKDNMAVSGATEEWKWVLHFSGCKRILALSKRNTVRLIEACGNETDAWVGAWVTLTVLPTPYKQTVVDGIWIKSIEPVAAPAAPAPAQTGENNAAPTTF